MTGIEDVNRGLDKGWEWRMEMEMAGFL